MRGAMFHSLGISFRDRFDQTRDLNDLLEAIDMHMDALHLRPPGHLDRCTSLVDLAQCLQARFSQTGNPNDVLETIGMFREALLLHPPGDPNRIGLLTELAVSLAAQLEHQDELRALAPALPDQDNAPAMRLVTSHHMSTASYWLIGLAFGHRPLSALWTSCEKPHAPLQPSYRIALRLPPCGYSIPGTTFTSRSLRP